MSLNFTVKSELIIFLPILTEEMEEILHHNPSMMIIQYS